MASPYSSPAQLTLTLSRRVVQNKPELLTKTVIWFWPLRIRLGAKTVLLSTRERVLSTGHRLSDPKAEGAYQKGVPTKTCGTMSGPHG